jgi:23S rRNA pseudouridine955/2504/2580 synthase
VLKSYGEERALLEVELVTGRTHQIRAHMSHIGHALLGDGKYGINRDERSKGFKYQALYAYKLYFKRTGEDNALSYLEDKTFSLDKEDIWFLKE